MIVRSGFIKCFPPLQVEWIQVKRLRKTKGSETYHECILDRVVDIVKFEGERGALAKAHVKQLIFKRQVLENRLLHAFCAGIHSLRDYDELLDRGPFLCRDDEVTSDIHSPPAISRSWRFGSNHRAGSIAIPHSRRPPSHVLFDNLLFRQLRNGILVMKPRGLVHHGWVDCVP